VIGRGKERSYDQNMPWYVGHFDETDHMNGRLLGFGGFFTTGGRLGGLGDTWESMREDIDMQGRDQTQLGR
jgi:hypothetical protein